LRIPFIAGNWKMNMLHESSLALISGLLQQVPKSDRVEVAVCPPHVYLSAVHAALRGSHIGLGAQNMHQQKDGAFTGEVSGPMLRDIGCRYVILGHSERRQFFGETDQGVNQKILAALECGLTPIVCVGETLAEREAGQTERVIETQCRGSLAGLSSTQGNQLVIAYEPVWAIGTGRTASPEQAQETQCYVRSVLERLFGGDVAEAVRIQYGGSVKPGNAGELIAQPDIDGFLVGGASLDPASFAEIVKAGL